MFLAATAAGIKFEIRSVDVSSYRIMEELFQLLLDFMEVFPSE